MGTTTPSLTCEALRKKAAEFPCFVEGMFDDWEPFIRRTFKGTMYYHSMDEQTEKMLQDTSLYALLFHIYKEDFLETIDMFEDAGATNIWLEIETNLGEAICIQSPKICGEFEQGIVHFDVHEYEVFFPKDGEQYTELWNSDKKSHTENRRYSLQKFIHGPDWEPEEETA